MGLGTIPSRSNGQTIDEQWFNLIKTVLSVDLVPRNASGVVVSEAGALGSSTYPWARVHANQAVVQANGQEVTIEGHASQSESFDLVLPKSEAEGCGFVPTAAIFPFAGSTAPDGYLLCDGSAVSRTTYARLFGVIGETHGEGDGATTFNLPDYRGRFLRGVDHAEGNDPDAAGRTAMATGGNTGDNVGSIQADDTAAHNHAANVSDPGHFHTVIGYEPPGTGNVQTGGGTTPQASTNTDTKTTGISVTTDNTGGNETRPINAYVEFIIKT